jgi:hypothetical protein
MKGFLNKVQSRVTGGPNPASTTGSASDRAGAGAGTGPQSSSINPLLPKEGAGPSGSSNQPSNINNGTMPSISSNQSVGGKSLLGEGMPLTNGKSSPVGEGMASRTNPDGVPRADIAIPKIKEKK